MISFEESLIFNTNREACKSPDLVKAILHGIRDYILKEDKSTLEISKRNQKM